MDNRQAAFLKRPELPEKDYDLATIQPHRTVSIQPSSWGWFFPVLGVMVLLAVAFFALQFAGCFDGSYR